MRQVELTGEAMDEFKAVSDRLRRRDDYGAGPPMKYGRIYEDLIAGKTLQASSAWSGLRVSSTFRVPLRRRGYKLHIHKRPEGVVFWAVKIVKEEG
jgi:hypothetical protein